MRFWIGVTWGCWLVLGCGGASRHDEPVTSSQAGAADAGAGQTNVGGTDSGGAGIGGMAPGGSTATGGNGLGGVCASAGRAVTEGAERMPNPASLPLPNPASYDTQAPEIVVDRVTGLSWQRVAAAPTDFDPANAACAALVLAGKDDWRLPTRIELASLVDFTSSPAIDKSAFADTPAVWFWSGSSVAGTEEPWAIDFASGSAEPHGVHDPAAARCVRADQTPEHHFKARGAVVSDALTGLTWESTIDGASKLTFDQAAEHCRMLRTEGACDWRVPSMKELQTLLIDELSHPALDPDAFPGAPGGFQWTSSLDSADDSRAWIVSASDGEVVTSSRLDSFAVRCVR